MVLCRAAICGRTFPCRMPHSKSHIPHPSSHIQHPTFHIQHPTFHIQHSTFHIPHSTISTLLPQIYTVFPVAPHPASKYAILAHLCNHLTFNRLPSKDPIRYPHTPHSAPQKAMFRPSIPALSRLHLLPFEARYLSPRNPKHAQRPIPHLPLPTQNAQKVPPATLFRPKARHTFYTKISYCRALNMKHRITFHVTPADLHFLPPSGQWVR